MNFWDHHGVFFLIFIFLFPRITLLVATGVPFGVWSWVGWFFVPRFVVAYWATVVYGDHNTILCAAAWVAAILGTHGAFKAKTRVSRR